LYIYLFFCLLLCLQRSSFVLAAMRLVEQGSPDHNLGDLVGINV